MGHRLPRLRSAVKSRACGQCSNTAVISVHSKTTNDADICLLIYIGALTHNQFVGEKGRVTDFAKMAVIESLPLRQFHESQSLKTPRPVSRTTISVSKKFENRRNPTSPFCSPVR
jgi:hypothetical protein